MTSQPDDAYSPYSYSSSRSSPDYYPTTSSSYPPRSASVSPHELTLLTHHFGRQSLRHDPRNVSTACHNASASSGPYHQSVSQTHESSSTHHTSYQSHQSSLPSPRQVNSMVQCQAGHVLQLPALIEHMVVTGQCSICVAAMASQTQIIEAWDDETMGEEDDFEDEGFAEPPSITRLAYRRSTDLSSSGQGYVAKAIRVRKKRRSDPTRSQ